jgi:hypothetical protein
MAPAVKPARPRTLAQLTAHPWVESIDDARGSGDGLHVYLMPGYVWTETACTVIEPTVREVCQAFRDVVWDPEGWAGITGASAAELAALTGEATPAPAAPAPRRRLNPLAEMLLMRLQATSRDWLVVEVCPIVGTLKGLGWIVTRHHYGTGVECQITISGRHALAARPCDGEAEATPAPRPVLPGEATPPPAPSHGDAAPTLPQLRADAAAGRPVSLSAVARAAQSEMVARRAARRAALTGG